MLKKLPLTPGERIIDGRVCYSAAWLDRAPVSERSRRVKQGLLLAQPCPPLRSPRTDGQHDVEPVE